MGKLALFGGKPITNRVELKPCPQNTKDLEKWLLNALRSGRLEYNEDSICRDFEESFATYHDMKYAVATNSGTSALWLSFFSAGIGKRSGGESNDEVIVPAYGFFATISPLLHVEAKPVFCDVDKQTGNLTPHLIEQHINQNTRAIVVTHIAGHPADMPSLCQIAKKHDLLVIEDCSHAHGATLDNQLVGTFGDISAFSLQTGKMISAGEGGVLLTDNSGYLIRSSAWGNFRRLQGTRHVLPLDIQETGLGLKLRLGPLGASLAHYHLANLKRFVSMRKERLEYLTSRIEKIQGLRPPYNSSNVTRGAYYEYPVRIDAAKDLPSLPRLIEKALGAEGTPARHSNTKAVYKYQLFDGLLSRGVNRLRMRSLLPNSERRTSFPIADEIEACTFNLPTFTFEDYQVIDQYVTALNKIMENISELIEWGEQEEIK